MYSCLTEPGQEWLNLLHSSTAFAEVLLSADHGQESTICLSDECPLRLSQGSEPVFRRRLCRSFSLSYGFNHQYHGRGREFESRRPRHSFNDLQTSPEVEGPLRYSTIQFWIYPSQDHLNFAARSDFLSILNNSLRAVLQMATTAGCCILRSAEMA